MAFSMLPLIALLLLAPVMILGIALFIIGLIKKRPAMWGSGIAIGVLGLLVLTIGAGMLMFFGVSQASSQMMAAKLKAVSSSSSNSFENFTGVALPPGVSVTSQCSIHSSAGNGPANITMYHMYVPRDFDEFLAANFTKAQWSTVAPTFQAGRMGDQSFLPGDSQLQTLSLHALTAQPDPNSPATFITTVAHDADTQEAWVVSVEKPTPAE